MHVVFWGGNCEEITMHCYNEEVNQIVILNPESISNGLLLKIHFFVKICGDQFISETAKICLSLSLDNVQLVLLLEL